MIKELSFLTATTKAIKASGNGKQTHEFLPAGSYTSKSLRVVRQVGQVFGRLTVLTPNAGRRGHQRYALCRCQCGKEKLVACGSLAAGTTRSCGCLTAEVAFKHGDAKCGRPTKEYWAWHSMKKRCFNPRAREYRYYGGRGITICDGWLNYAQFLADIGRAPSKTHSIERIDNNGNYEPNNCRWATMLEQGGNKRWNRMMTGYGEIHHVAEWARRLGVNAHTLRDHAKKGRTIEQFMEVRRSRGSVAA